MPPKPSTKLPESVQEIADVIGREKALDFIRQLPRSGSRKWRACIYIPKSLPMDHELVSMLGWEDANKICYAFSGMILQPSTLKGMERAHRNKQIARAHAEGVPVSEIADVYEMSKYQIREIIAHARKSEREAAYG
ncbi:Mor transcription activator family protein [Pelagimonas phthalicica]|uniref:Mor transcription activator family protein n=1 Tax=Pelagimonas phthalicica TaxID=1037362 RepID=A0A238JAW0_9RHOB|nr:Mor transcription activator family protein [Pelagimonas phthalicica]TDS94198.1 Mor transcription activator family protein [Pelagimonas phthalicica]SMX27277.1 Mor transcription activator family protein [Pelagimonas phthalicica]